MICWLVGGEDAPLEVFEVAKASTVSELRNWAARRVATDDELDDDAFPLFIEHSTWEGEWAAEDVPALVEELEELHALAAEQEKYTPEVTWRSMIFDRCLRAARYAAGARERITIR